MKLDSKMITRLQIIALLLAAIVIAVPAAMNMMTLHNNFEVVTEYTNLDEQKKKEQLEEMQKKNDEITVENFYTVQEDPFSKSNTQDSDFNVIGVLHIPKINLQLAIYDKTNTETLAKGLGLLDGTHYPTGGIGRTSVITGHRGTGDADMFKHLDQLENGDVFYVESGGQKLYYKMYKRLITLPTDTSTVELIPNKDTVILLTCDTPDPLKGLNTHRLLVYAERTEPTEEEIDSIKKQVDDSTRSIEPQFAIMGLIGLGIVLAILVAALVRSFKHGK